MQHVNLYVLRLCMLNGLATGFMGNLLGEDDHGIGIANTCLEVRSVMQNALELNATLLCCLDVVLLQSVNAAYQCDAHTVSLTVLLISLGAMVGLREVNH